MSNEVTVKQQTAMTTSSGQAFGSEGISQSDIMLPKLLIMQKMSKLLDHPDMKAKEGDIVDSLTKQVVASSDSGVDIIPLFMRKFWRVAEGVGQNQTLRRYPIDASNINWGYEDVNPETKTPIKRHIEVDWYVLLPKDIDAGALPCVITFKKTSMPASKKLATFTVLAAQMKLPACAFVYKLKSVKQSNEHGSFCVFEIGDRRKSNETELSTALMWYKTLNSTGHMVDDESIDEETPF